jgi:HAD superfamily hydrolase (TIGR01549 family)
VKYPIVLWDSGGTIFHFDERPEGYGAFPSPDEVKAQRARRAGHALEMFGRKAPVDLAAILTRLGENLRRQHGLFYSLEILADGLYRELGIGPRREESLLLADALAGPRYRAWLWAGVAEALETMHRAGVRMGVVADTDWTGRLMRRALAGVDLERFFAAVICSCDLGVRKPDSRIFHAGLAALGPFVSAPGPILYVGDDPANDIGGARASGWDAALHLTPSESGSAGAILEFSDYRDLVRLVLG